MKKTKDIFISYKRSDGENYAKRFYKDLVELGYSVFLDTEILQNGRYEKDIMKRIENSTDFIIIVTPDFINDESLSWIKMEVDCALQAMRNIIPIYYTDPKTIGESVSAINMYNGITAVGVAQEKIITLLKEKFLLSTQELAYKDDPEKDDISNMKEYLNRHSTRAFMEVAIGAYRDGEIHDSNYSLALMAQESDYDVITCLWAILFKCTQMLNEVPNDCSPKLEITKSLLGFVEDMLANCAVLIDEGKLDTANRFFPQAKKLLVDIIATIESNAFDE